jgi:hypothetical protein
MSATGNPVFDYRASFRAGAQAVQRALILGGLLLFVACGLGYLFGDLTARVHCAAGILSASGFVLFLAGVAWGFYWRHKMRADFRIAFGPRS